MRLLDTETIEIREFEGDSLPGYAILSHTWGIEEVSYQLLKSGKNKDCQGYKKILACCERALSEAYLYVWIDTCCIDKTSSAELSEAINSMWRWYEKAQVCYVYLDDVRAGTSKNVVVGLDPELYPQFRRSRWFTRGWTLQELLAPNKVIFHDMHWKPLGERWPLRLEICAATGISEVHLRRPRIASVAAKMSWASKRVTSRPEDVAYSLMGLFDVYMPLLYGEGVHAFLRLQQEIVRSSNDESIFAWVGNSKWVESSIFAPSPAEFATSGDIIPFHHSAIRRKHYSITNYGLEVELGYDWSENDTKTYNYCMPLACTRANERRILNIDLRPMSGDRRHLVRNQPYSLWSSEAYFLEPGKYHTVYIKSDSYFRTLGWCESALEVRMGEAFREHVTYRGLVSPYPVSVTMKENKIIFSEHGEHVHAIKFTHDRGRPEFALKWQLDQRIKTVQGKLAVQKDQHPLDSLYEIDVHGEPYPWSTDEWIEVPMSRYFYLEVKFWNLMARGRATIVSMDLKPGRPPSAAGQAETSKDQSLPDGLVEVNTEVSDYQLRYGLVDDAGDFGSPIIIDTETPIRRSTMEDVD